MKFSAEKPRLRVAAKRWHSLNWTLEIRDGYCYIKMKVLGPLLYLTWNYGVILLLKDCFYIVTLNTKTSLKYVIYNEVPFLYSDPLDGLTTATIDDFLKKYQYLKIDYNDNVKVT